MKPMKSPIDIPSGGSSKPEVSGRITSAPRNPPRKTKLPISGPTIYPTASSAGESSMPKKKVVRDWVMVPNSGNRPWKVK